MLGLVVLFICAVYLGISLMVITMAWKFTKRRWQRG